MGRIVLWLRASEGSDLLLLGLLGEEDSLDVGEDTTLGNGDSSQQLVQLLVVTDGQLQVTGDDPGLLVVTGSIACQLKDLSSQVLHDGSQVDGCTSTDTLSIVALPEQTVDTTDWKREPSTGRTGLGLALLLKGEQYSDEQYSRKRCHDYLGLSAFASPGHGGLFCFK